MIIQIHLAFLETNKGRWILRVKLSRLARLVHAKNTPLLLFWQFSNPAKPEFPTPFGTCAAAQAPWFSRHKKTLYSRRLGFALRKKLSSSLLKILVTPGDLKFKMYICLAENTTNLSHRSCQTAIGTLSPCWNNPYSIAK